MRARTLTFLVMICALSKAQINLENSYPATAQYQNMQVVELVKSGYKYELANLQTGNFKLYNLNHSIYKNINLPIPSGYSLYSYPQASDSLFNTDNLVEVFYTCITYTPSVNYETKVIDENGSAIITIPQGAYSYVAYTGAANGYKLIVNVDSLNKGTLKQINVYSLAGGYPIHTTPANTTGISTNKPISFLSSPVPNPSTGKTVIGYQLPPGEAIGNLMIYDINGKELRRYQVDNSFSTLELDNSDLPSGTYFYQMSGSASGQKMVIIK
jgi:hypothetical protein